MKTVHIFDLEDEHGRSLAYATHVTNAPCGRYRVTGLVLKDGRPHGRGSAPLLVRTREEADALVTTLVMKAKRKFETTTAGAYPKSQAVES